MKKGFMELTMCAALSFLILISAISLSEGKQTGQTPAVSKQQTSATPVESVVPKPALWDLAVDHFIVAGQSFPFPNDYNQAKVINVTVGQTINCQCFYKVKTIAVGDITKADANFWGAGNLSYKISGGLFFPGPPSHQEYKTETRTLPKFTSADVQAWKNQIGASGRKEWMETLVYNWTATPQHVGKSVALHFDVDSFMNIKETDEQNNGSFASSGIVAKFIVKPQEAAKLDTVKPVAVNKLPDTLKIHPGDLTGRRYKAETTALSPAFYAAWKGVTDSYQAMTTLIPRYEEQSKIYIQKCQECKNRVFTQQDMAAAGCLPSDTVAACSQKLYRWCSAPFEPAGMFLAMDSNLRVISSSSKTAEQEFIKSVLDQK